MVDITARLIPYTDRDDLTRRVAALFNWQKGGDPLPPNFSTNPQLPNGVLVSYPRNSFAFDYSPGEELSDLIWYLPPEHKFVQEILRQAEANLREIVEKTKDDLKVRQPRYLNALVSVGGSGHYEGLFDLVQQAAYHIIDLDIVTDDNPPQEGRIVWAATEGVIADRYCKSHPQEVKKFLDHAWEKRVTLPFIVTGYRDLGDERAIEIYFEIFRAAHGETDFVMNGLQRSFDFKVIGWFLKGKFTDYTFKDHYRDIEGDQLRSKLDAIFT